MFMQKFGNGAIYKNLSTMQYVLRIDGKEYFGDTILKLMKQYTKAQAPKKKKEK